MTRQRNTVELGILLICFAATIGLQLWQLFPLREILLGDDWIYHYLRMDAAAERLHFFDFVTEVNHVYFEGAGYADFAYPLTMLYLPALLRQLGCGIGFSMSVFLIFCCVLTYVTAYVSVKDISGDPFAATLAAVVYSLAPYRLDCLFTRFALGEVQAFIFWPLVLWGLYDLIARDGKRLWILGLGLGGMLLSHSLSTLLACVVCAVFCLVFIKRLLADKAKGRRLLFTAALTMAMTAFYWIPLLRFVTLNDLNLFYPDRLAADNTVEASLVFSNIRLSATQAGIGVLLVVVACSRLLLGRRSPLGRLLREGAADARFVDACLVTGFAALFCATDLAPWKLLGLLFNSLQFSFRLYAVVTVCLAVGGGICLCYVLRGIKAKRLGVSVVCLLCVLAAVSHIGVIGPRHTSNRPDDYYYATSASRAVCNGEWLPRSAKESITELEGQLHRLLLDDKTAVPFERERETLTFSVQQPCDYATVPFIYYHDYKAYDENGTRLTVTESEQGLVKVALTGVTGQVTVRYTVSFVTKAAYALSVITWIAVAAVCGRVYVRRKKSAAPPRGETA